MDNTRYLTIGVPFLCVLVLINAVFTKIIFSWEPAPGKRFLLLLVLWLIPFLGALMVYRNFDLAWFTKEDDAGGSNAASTGFLEMDAIFNPGSKHVVEEIQRVKTEVRKEGEMFDDHSSAIDPTELADPSELKDSKDKL